MTTHHAVWPPDLIERREAAAQLAAQLRAEAAAETRESLAAEMAALPCPHWDLHLDEVHGVNWICEACAAVIAPIWVPLREQEAQLRRLKGR